MKLEITTRNCSVKNYVKDDVEQKIGKLEKYFKEDLKVVVTFAGEGETKKVEITVYAKNNVLRSEVSAGDAYVALDKAIDKIERQLVKYKDKLRKRNNDSIRYENIVEENSEQTFNIVKNKKFELIPMTAQEATFQLELLEHNFFVFLNKDTEKICVVYKREDGDYGIIEAEM